MFSKAHVGFNPLVSPAPEAASLVLTGRLLASAATSLWPWEVAASLGASAVYKMGVSPASGL